MPNKKCSNICKTIKGRKCESKILYTVNLIFKYSHIYTILTMHKLREYCYLDLLLNIKLQTNKMIKKSLA